MSVNIANNESDWRLIQVKNWEKYNPRTDRKKHSWFRLQNDIISEPKFFGLSAAQKFVAICLIAEVARAGGTRAKIHLPWLADQLKVSHEDVEITIETLLAREVFCPPTPPDPKRSPPVTSGDQSVSTGVPTDGRTDGRDGQNEQNVPDPAYTARARDTGPGTGPEEGDACGQGVRDRGPASEPALDFAEVSELIASELATQAASLAPAPVAALPPDPPVAEPPRETRPETPDQTRSRPPDSPARRVIPGPWPARPAPNIARPTPNIRPRGPNISPSARPALRHEPRPAIRANPEHDWGPMPDFVRRFSKSWAEPRRNPEEASA